MVTPFMFLLFTVGLIVSIICTVLVIGYIVVPLFRGAGNLITAIFKGIGFIVRHIAEWVTGTLTDLIRMVGAVIAAIVLLPVMLVSVLIGRWSAASHFANSVVAETRIAGLCLYRAMLRRPLHLLFLDGLVEGLEQRIPLAMENAPTRDLPRPGLPAFDGYRITGSLRAGGSGAKLHVAEPDETLRKRRPDLPRQVVIKSFAISEGSALPQIVRESRALDAARQLGLVFDHGIDANRFFYVMPYHPGDNLGVVTRRLHGESGTDGLEGEHLRQATSLVSDLLETLVVFHSGGLWHKDIKPDNIMVHDGKAHVVDLGLVTPLRSAMTLTTHGTEYFRDPELVRMALRGVKVHQVDGAKFDIFAAGAVLYFVLENTFPAHGGLSAFTRRSPEALRWIVRRAMAEYSKRYERAETMLADMRFVLASNDPFAVRPAQLPSMRGAAAVPDPPPHETPHVGPSLGGSQVGGTHFGASAADPRRGVGVDHGAGRAAARERHQDEPGWARAFSKAAASVSATFGATAADPASPWGASGTASLSSGPNLRVTDWWAGKYEPAFEPGPMRRGLTARQQREAIKERARAATVAASAAVRRPRDPSSALIVLTVLMIGVIIAATLLLPLALPSLLATNVRPMRGGTVETTSTQLPSPAGTTARSGSPATASATGKTNGSTHPAVAPNFLIDGVPVVATSGEALVDAPSTTADRQRRVLLLNQHHSPASPDVIELIDRMALQLELHGYTVIADDTESSARLLPTYLIWMNAAAAHQDDLEGLLDRAGYGGVLWIYAGPIATPHEGRNRFSEAHAKVVLMPVPESDAETDSGASPDASSDPTDDAFDDGPADGAAPDGAARHHFVDEAFAFVPNASERGAVIAVRRAA